MEWTDEVWAALSSEQKEQLLKAAIEQLFTFDEIKEIVE